MAAEIRLRRAGVGDLRVVLGMVRALAEQHAAYDARRFVVGGGAGSGGRGEELEGLYRGWLEASEVGGEVVVMVAETTGQGGVAGRGGRAGGPRGGETSSGGAAPPHSPPPTAGDGGGVRGSPSQNGAVGYFIAEHLPADARYFSTACAYLHDIYMAPEARGSGLGRRMLAELRAWAGSRGVSQVRAMVWPGNERALKFFAAEGFRETSVELTWDSPT